MPETNTEKPRVITISTATIFKVVVLALLLGFLYLIRHIILLFFVALVLASVINPLAAWFQSKRLRRGTAVLILYIGLLAILALILWTFVPPMLSEARELIGNADAIWARVLNLLGPLQDFLDKHGLSDTLTEAWSSLTGNVGKAAGGVVTGIRALAAGVVSFIVILVVTFWLVVTEDALKKFFRAVSPEKYQPYLIDLFERVEKALGAWAKGQLILSLIMGSAVYMMLTIMGVKYALVLGLTAAVTEFIPYVGPPLAAIPAVLIALTQSPLRAVMVVALYYVLHLIESHILIPQVMRKATGLHPIVSIFSMLVGAQIAGLFGVLLAIPCATSISIIAGDISKMVKENR